MNVSVIIPNWNGRPLLEKNLPSIASAFEKKENKILEVIIVDDASSDDSVSFVRKNFPKFKVIQHRVNRGFSSSVNTGVRTAKGRLVVLLNSDVSVTSNFLVPVGRHFENKKTFGVSLNEQDFGWAQGKFEEGFVVHEGKPADRKVHETFWISGGSGVFRRDLWIKLGGLDEKLLSPFYWEDIDISYRAHKRGYLLFWEPTAVVNHKHESTIRPYFGKGRLEKIRERNQLIFIWKNLTSQNLFRKHLQGLLKRLASHPRYILVVIAALSKFFEIRKARVKEKKEGRISDEAIFARFK